MSRIIAALAAHQGELPPITPAMARKNYRDLAQAIGVSVPAFLLDDEDQDEEVAC